MILFHYVYPSQDVIPRSLWNDLLDRLRNEIANPNPGAAFRGSLIDPNMFAIDVNEWGMEDMLEDYRERRTPKISADNLDPAA